MYRIAEARVARGWSQQQLAEASGLTQQSIARYESGQRDPQASAIKALSSALNVTVDFAYTCVYVNASACGYVNLRKARKA